MRRFTWLLSAFLSLQPLALVAAESQCYGTVSNGRLEGGVKLPSEGPNFTSYSTLAAAAGRTYVHSKVAEIIVLAYEALAKDKPSNTYVYGETGWSSGGRIRPHRTHQNGLSVDFFVPVQDASGKSVPLPTSVTNKLGYDIEFNAKAKYEEYTIDFEATAEHLYQLQVAAKANGAGIALVIFDIEFLPKLFATARGPYLQKELPFMKGKPWVRHDEHYHVDFRVPCKQNAG
ncbi:MAG: replication initiation protein [Burkholderiales bacterium PBB2]|nr:MAG: replication initiation protein [Burkholderiales bacterium PBB2]